MRPEFLEWSLLPLNRAIGRRVDDPIARRAECQPTRSCRATVTQTPQPGEPAWENKAERFLGKHPLVVGGLMALVPAVLIPVLISRQASLREVLLAGVVIWLIFGTMVSVPILVWSRSIHRRPERKGLLTAWMIRHPYRSAGIAGVGNFVLGSTRAILPKYTLPHALTRSAITAVSLMALLCIMAVFTKRLRESFPEPSGGGPGRSDGQS